VKLMLLVWLLLLLGGDRGRQHRSGVLGCRSSDAVTIVSCGGLQRRV